MKLPIRLPPSEERETRVAEEKGCVGVWKVPAQSRRQRAHKQDWQRKTSATQRLGGYGKSFPAISIHGVISTKHNPGKPHIVSRNFTNYQLFFG